MERLLEVRDQDVIQIDPERPKEKQARNQNQWQKETTLGNRNGRIPHISPATLKLDQDAHNHRLRTNAGR